MTTDSIRLRSAATWAEHFSKPPALIAALWAAYAAALKAETDLGE